MLLSLQVLDLLEISGNQHRTARFLSMHQTTVSRSYRDLIRQFRLQPQTPPRQVCRWGTSTSLRLLRLACRAHRLEDGRLRLASDALHHSLLQGMAGVLDVPPCFHHADDWAALVSQAVIDGALVSSLCHPCPLPLGELPRWPGIRVLPLGTLALQLVCHHRWQQAWDQTVLVPGCQVMPLLHQQLEGAVNTLEQPPRTWQDPQLWLEQLHHRPLALPICPGLAPRSWWEQQGLVAAGDQLNVQEQLWLLLPDDGLTVLPRAAQASLRLLQRRVRRASAQGDAARLQVRQLHRTVEPEAAAAWRDDQQLVG